MNTCTYKNVGVQADRRKSRKKAHKHKRRDLQKWGHNFNDMQI